ncbi:trehalase-like [Crocuta crocuta]
MSESQCPDVVPNPPVYAGGPPDAAPARPCTSFRDGSGEGDAALHGQYLGASFLYSLCAAAMQPCQDSQILTYQYGIPTSLQKTGQQWDFPNAWAPLQDLVITGLAKSPSPRAQEVAFQLAQNWIRTTFEVYSRKSAMYEKYDVSNGGQPGGGGEYEVQEGFGWTNGVVLMLLDHYDDQLAVATSQRNEVPVFLDLT